MFAKLLVPLDRSPLAEQAIGRAAALARQCRAELDLVLVQEPFPQAVPTDPIWSEVDLAVDQKYLEQIASELTSGAALTVTFAVLNGFAAEMICTRAAEVHADLIVMTTHGRTGLSRTWLGSVADAVMRRSFVPVLMLRPLATAHDRKALQQPFRQVLVPLDGSAAATDVLEAAVALANANEAGISLLRVVPAVPLMLPLDPTMPYAFAPVIPDESATNTLVADVKEQLEETARRLREQSGLPVDAHVRVSEQTADSIVDFAVAHEIGVIAMSTQGRGASRLLLGSVADKVLRSSGLPVLLRRSNRAGRASEIITDDSVAEELPALTTP